MSARSSSSSTTGRRGSHGATAAPLALGVKGRLSNQEMEQLKHRLAAAVAYDHVPEDARAERHRKPTSTPMTRVYRTLQPESSDTNHSKNFRPSIKPQAAIEYEKKFSEGAYDALRMRPAPRGIGASAKSVLQDEYVTRPREISVIPRNTHTDQCHGSGGSAHGSSSVAASAAATVTGKRHAPAAIPQVFIL